MEAPTIEELQQQLAQAQAEAAARRQELEQAKAEKSSLETEFRRLYAKDMLNEAAGKSLLSELEKLRAVAEAAEAVWNYLSLHRRGTDAISPVDRLRRALDALKQKP